MFSSFPAFQWYKVRSYAIDIYGVHFCYKTGIFTGAFRLDTRLLHDQISQSNSVKGTLSTRLLATQRYRVGPHAMDIHGVRFCYENGIYTGTFRLGTRFLHNQMSDSNSVSRTLF